ncbi:MAG: AAA family ATPase [Blastocatellia bacterium]|nr:AAA family ATPase [Blastocatellia bacterium]
MESKDLVLVMLTSIEFKNYKCLRDTELPLGRFTLLVGPNGSGKSTALRALQWKTVMDMKYADDKSIGLPSAEDISIKYYLDNPEFIPEKWVDDFIYFERLGKPQGISSIYSFPPLDKHDPQRRLVRLFFEATRVFSFVSSQLAVPTPIDKVQSLAEDGFGLPTVLDNLRNRHEDRFEAFQAEMCRIYPEFDRISFDTEATGVRSISMRTREGKFTIPFKLLSEGTLLTFGLVALAYLPDQPPVIGIEEPERAIHPRMLREVQDALYRLSYPELVGESRKPIQVVVTTHSPYFLDLFKDHPEEIVIAEKHGIEATFSRLTDRMDVDEILGDAPLGEAWYSGVLGGVPATP